MKLERKSAHRKVDLVLDFLRRGLLQHLLYLSLRESLVHLLGSTNGVCSDLIELNAKLEAKLIKLLVSY